jgi:hypothetical protein
VPAVPDVPAVPPVPLDVAAMRRGDCCCSFDLFLTNPLASLLPRSPPAAPSRLAAASFCQTQVIDQGWALYWGTSEWSVQQIEEAWQVAERLNLVGPGAPACQQRAAGASGSAGYICARAASRYAGFAVLLFLGSRCMHRLRGQLLPVLERSLCVLFAS